MNEVWIVEHRSRGRADLIWYPNYCFIHLTEEATLNICKERTLQYPDTEYRATKYIPATSATAPANQLRGDVASSVASDHLWRELLWLNHARYLPYKHIGYGDDGEMQCCGIDFKRWSSEEIDEHLRKRADHPLLGNATANPELHAPSSELVAEARRDEHFLACPNCNNSQVDGSRWTPCVRGMQLRANATQKVLAGDATAKSAARCPNCESE